MNKLLAAQLTFMAFLFMISVNAYSQACPGSPGCLDPAFGAGGITITRAPLATNLTFQSSTTEMVFQSDGKIVILTAARDTSNTFSGALARFTSDGAIDASFGDGGFAYISNSSGEYNPRDVAIQIVSGEERFVVTGTGVCGGVNCLKAQRFTKWGVLDTTFGTSGTATVNTGWSMGRMAIQSDQKILVSGGTNPMVRLKANGTADTSFGPNGISSTNPGMNIRAISVLSNGRILAAGETWGGATDWDIAAGRFNSNGTLDTSFGTNGRTSVDFAGKLNIAGDVTVDGNGKILVCGEAIYVSQVPYLKGFDAVLIRLKSDGKVDTTFGTGGKAAALNLGNLQDFFASVSVQSNGKILVVGESRFAGNNANSDTLTARYNANGTLDTTYSSTGWNMTDIYGAADPGVVGSVRLDPTCNCQKLVVAGIASSEQSATAIRYNTLFRYSL